MLEITKSIYWMPFPKSDIIEQLSTYLNKNFGPRYYIWNLSEHIYEREYFNYQVAAHQYPGFSSPPLYEQFLICKCILDWVRQGNVAIVHCQSNKGRSAILLSLLLGMINHQSPDEYYNLAIKSQLNISELFPSQQLYLKYCTNIYNNCTLNNDSIKLKSIILSSIPKKWATFRPQFQIMNRTQTIFEDFKQQITGNEICVFTPHELDISQDIIIKCKHLQQSTDSVDVLLIPVFRIQIHTGFMHENVIRFNKKDIDLSVEVDDDFFIDLFYHRGLDKWNQVELQQQKQDYQEQEGNSLINKLSKQCSNICNQLDQNLFQENIIDIPNDEVVQINHEQQELQNQQQEQAMKVPEYIKDSLVENECEENIII